MSHPLNFAVDIVTAVNTYIFQPTSQIKPQESELLRTFYLFIKIKQVDFSTYFYFSSRGINIVNWITMTRKSADMIYWTAVSTLLGLISSVYRNLHHWRSNQWPQIAVLKLYNWAISSYCTQVTLNQLVMVIARPNNLKITLKSLFLFR